VKRVVTIVSLLIAGAALAKNAPAPAAKPAAAPATVVPPPPVDPWAGRTDLFVAPKLASNAKIDVGVTRFTLPNGLEVLVVSRHQVPAIDLLLAVKAGAVDEPADKVGLSQFVASMLRKGTQKRTADQISDALDFVGASFDAEAGDLHSTLHCRARSRDLALCLDMTADVLEHATFPQSEMKEVHDQLLAGVEAIKDSPEELASQFGQNFYYGDEDPRGRAASKRSLAAIDRKSLVEFHKAWYAPNHAVLAVAGDVDPKTIKAQLTKAFAGWKKHPVPKQPELKLAVPAGLHVRLVDKPDATQAAIALLGPGIAHTAPDYYAVRLMSWALGSGVFSSRLMKVIRSEGGKTYSAHLGFGVGHFAEPWTASTFTRVAETASTVKLLIDTIEKMKTGGPTADELTDGKGNIVGGYGLRLETPTELAAVLLSSKLDGMDDKAVEEFPQRINAVTLANAAASAAAHLSATALTICGPAAQVKPQLEKAGFKVDEVLRYDEPISAMDRKLAAAELQKAGIIAPAEAEAGQKLVAAALAAKGGDLAKVTAIQMSGKGTMSMQGQQMQIAVEEFQVPGKAARQEISIGPMKMVQLLADGKAWMKQGDKVMELPADAAKGLQRGLLRDPNFIWLYVQKGLLKARGLAPVGDGAAKLDAVELIHPDGDKTEVLLDPKTHLIARFEFSEDGKTEKQSFSDYRAVNGIMIPHKVSQSGEGGELQVTYDKVTLNPTLPASTFKP
jgi:zinc protease